MNSDTELLPPPAAFGLPAKYEEWRPNQPHAILSMVEGETRFNTTVAPTGFGKSLSYMTAAAMTGRTVVLTGTKGLQTQLMADFGPSPGLKVVDIRGRNSYRCLREPGVGCDIGPCTIGVTCSLRDNGCLYYDQYRKALRADVIVTNYAYWMTINDHGEGLGRFDLMVCDEAHSMPDTVATYMTVSLDRKDKSVSRILPKGSLHHMSRGEWKEWARIHAGRLSAEIEYRKEQVRMHGYSGMKDVSSFGSIKKLYDGLRKVATLNDDWVIDPGDRYVEFAPTWPYSYCEGFLFLGSPRVTLTSASVCAKTLDMAGIEKEYRSITEYPHSFPVENRMLTHIPTIRVNYRTTEAEMRMWLSRIDSIIRGRQDRKGIIHTVSYKRRDFIANHSRYKSLLITHGRRDAEAVVRNFKGLSPPAVLVSPSMSTGWDFPYDDATYQIIGKLSYPDTTSGVTKARTKADPEYAAYVAMQQLVQACGRGVRAQDDVCENLVIDDNIGWFMQRHGEFAPAWFREAYRRSATIPAPPERPWAGG